MTKPFKPEGIPADELLRRTNPRGSDYVVARRHATFQPYVCWHVDKQGNCSSGNYCEELTTAVDHLIRLTDAKGSDETREALYHEARMNEQRVYESAGR